MEIYKPLTTLQLSFGRYLVEPWRFYSSHMCFWNGAACVCLLTISFSGTFHISSGHLYANHSISSLPIIITRWNCVDFFCWKRWPYFNPILCVNKILPFEKYRHYCQYCKEQEWKSVEILVGSSVVFIMKTSDKWLPRELSAMRLESLRCWRVSHRKKRLSHYLGLGRINSHATHSVLAFEMVSREPTIKAENVQKQKEKKTLQTIWKLINSYDSHCSRQCTDMSGMASSNAWSH